VKRAKRPWQPRWGGKRQRQRDHMMKKAAAELERRVKRAGEQTMPERSEGGGDT